MRAVETITVRVHVRWRCFEDWTVKERTQSGPQILNDDASENMLSVSVTLETSPFEISRLNLIAVTNISQMLWTLDVSHLGMSSVEGIAFENIPFVVGTLDVSRLGRKRLKDLTTLN